MKSNSSEWMSISDMMSGLMLVFMFIAISFMIQVEIDKEKIEKIAEINKKDKERIQEIAKTYEKDKEELNKALHKEFSKDLERWEAEITENNVIIFSSPNVLFEVGKSLIKQEFKNILQEFFPRYIKVLSSNKYQNEIDEIRVEGHTSNGWNSATSKQKIYLKNMKLSQDRANNVLSYCYLINDKLVTENREWLEKHFRANGMAFSKLKYQDKEKKIENSIKSRRVEFKVQMKTEEKIYKILETSN